MAFFMSPGVLVVERDLTNSIPAVATSIGGYAGAFQWGPVLDPLTIGSELELVKTFGKPNSEVAASFFSASNFLGYSNNLKVVRNVGTLAKNAVDVQSGTVTDIDISAGGSGYSGTATVVIGAPDDPSGVQAVATATIGGGAITAITITNPGSGYLSAPAASITGNGTGATLVATVTLAGALVKNETHWEDNFSAGEGVHGLWAAKYPGELGNSILVSIADSASYAAWDYKDREPLRSLLIFRVPTTNSTSLWWTRVACSPEFREPFSKLGHTFPRRRTPRRKLVQTTTTKKSFVGRSTSGGWITQRQA
jgi:hypothetical protein